MADKVQVRLGPVQQTLFITLAARARETGKKRPVLSDPKAVEMIASVDLDTTRRGAGLGGGISVIRTAIFDWWVRGFLARHPAGTVIEIGTGLNTRFERVDNGQVHWLDLDLPDTIALRRNFFDDTDRRQMVAASALEQDWLQTVQDSPGPYFFVADGVLVYLAEAPQVLTRIAERFPGALIAFDTYSQRTFDQQHKMAAKGKMEARWAWSCDDPRSLQPLGLEIAEAATITRPPRALLTELPRRYRYLLPVASRVIGGVAAVTLFRARSR